MGMTIITSDEKMTVDIGGADIWNSLKSTVETRLGSLKSDISKAVNFLNTGKCNAKNGLETARQFNIIRDEFAKLSVEEIVYDANDPEMEVPWKNNISPTITSCANFYTTSDGKDLLCEIVSILCYAQSNNVSIEII